MPNVLLHATVMRGKARYIKGSVVVFDDAVAADIVERKDGVITQDPRRRVLREVDDVDDSKPRRGIKPGRRRAR